MTTQQLKKIYLPYNVPDKLWGALYGSQVKLVSIYDVLAQFSNTPIINTDYSLKGNGTVEYPLGLKQQGASSGQTLVWSGTQWSPSTDTSLKMTASEIDALTPTEGFTVYNLTSHKTQTWDGGAWQNHW